MIRHYLNHKGTFAACPILGEEAVSAYLSNGEVPSGTDYQPIPPGKIVRRRAFWLQPKTRFSADATIFLVSTETCAMSAADDPCEPGEQILCYFSHVSGSMYLGALRDDLLHPLINGHYPPLNIGELEYIGRVIAAI